MSGYGFGECKLCGARDDYCTIQGAQGVDMDCRHLSDLLTDEQAAKVRAELTPEWWIEEQKK